MSIWLQVFIAVAAFAIVLQTILLVGLVASMKKTFEQLAKVSTEFESRFEPIMTRTSRILEEAEPRISAVIADAAEITRLAREQVQKVDQVFTDATERARIQVARVDQVVTGALEVVEETGSAVRRTVWAPVQQVSAIMKGIKVGLSFLRNHRQSGDPIEQDEELFI